MGRLESGFDNDKRRYASGRWMDAPPQCTSFYFIFCLFAFLPFCLCVSFFFISLVFSFISDFSRFLLRLRSGYVSMISYSVISLALLKFSPIFFVIFCRLLHLVRFFPPPRSYAYTLLLASNPTLGQLARLIYIIFYIIYGDVFFLGWGGSMCACWVHASPAKWFGVGAETS